MNFVAKADTAMQTQENLLLWFTAASFYSCFAIPIIAEW
jgi:hypothetical protein